MGVNVSELTFVDLDLDKYGDFGEGELEDPEKGPCPLRDFLETPLGQASLESFNEQFKAQQGYTPSDNTIQLAFATAQSLQPYPGEINTISDQQMLDDHGPSWIAQLDIGGTFKAAMDWGQETIGEPLNEVVGDALVAGTGALRSDVLNEGMTGKTADLIIEQPDKNQAIVDNSAIGLPGLGNS